MIVAVSYPTNRDKLIESSTREDFKASLEGNILHVWDVIDDRTIQQIVDKFGKPRYIVMDSFSYYKTTFDIPVYCVDAWVENQLKEMELSRVCRVENISTNCVANLLINKKQINRFLAMKLCEIFNIDANYTWSGIGKTFDLTPVVEEKQLLVDSVIAEYWTEMLSPISKFEKKWYQLGDVTYNDSSVTNYGNNIAVWNNHLMDIVSTSAISIITESVSTHTATTFTEKTVYSVLGLTFPIWVGGVDSALHWEQKGFDTFSDVIDHSYQNLPTLLERCFYAFYLNRDLLTNLEKVSDLRNQHLGRLIENRKLMTADTFKNYNQKIIQTWPDDLQILANDSIITHLHNLTSYI